MLILKGPAPNLDLGPSGPRTQKKQDPEPRTLKPGTPNPTLRIPKISRRLQNSIFSFQKMLVLKGPAPNLDPGPSGPRTHKKQDPEPRIPKARTPNRNLKIPKFQGFPKLDFFLSKNAYFKGSGAKSGPWAFWTPNPQEARPRTQNSKSQNPEPKSKNSKISRLSKTRFFPFKKCLF